MVPKGMNWYCVHTKPKKEALVLHYCQEQLGQETYFPKIKRRKTIRRVKRVVTEAMFPRYIFCRFDPTSHYRTIKYAKDVLGIISFGEKPTIVPDHIIKELKDWAGSELDLISFEPEPQPGDEVEILEGPFMGLKAIFLEDMGKDERVSLLLSMMDSEAKLSIEHSKIRKTEAS